MAMPRRAVPGGVLDQVGEDLLQLVEVGVDRREAIVEDDAGLQLGVRRWPASPRTASAMAGTVDHLGGAAPGRPVSRRLMSGRSVIRR